jgi:small ligand-binding sensory domain FIST
MSGRDAPTGARFASAAATGEDWRTTVKACLDKLGPVDGCNLGFLYISDSLAADAVSIVTLMRGVTGIKDWVGTVGIGICATAEELFDRPAIAVMAAQLPPGSFHLPAPITESIEGFAPETEEWLKTHGPVLGLVHGDPRNPHTHDIIPELSDALGGFLVGGLTSSRTNYGQFGGRPGTAPVIEGGVSGVLFSSEVPVATGLTQGCTPIAAAHKITRAQNNIIIEIDGRPALDVFKEDIGELLARDLRRVAGYIFAALPITGSDTGDYLVRNLVGIDPNHGLIAIGDMVEPGRSIMFARRDLASAQADLERMLSVIKRRLKGPPRGGIYVSCLARGPALFGDDSQELKTIRDALGEFPLVGFFANGEISHNRLYGYTGVLTLFL